MNKTIKKLVAPLAFASLATISGAALAADQAGNANVTVLAALSIAETTEIDFGVLTSEDGTCTMASGGGLTGSAGQSCSGTETPATFTVTGTDAQTVDVSVTVGSAVDGVTYTPVIDGAGSRTLSGGTAAVDVIGNLALSSATSGVKDIAYTFTANYQ